MAEAMVTNVKPRAADLLAQMAGGALYRAAYERGQNLSTYLEDEDPSDGYKDGLDAFGRVMKASGIRVNSLPALGIYAHEFGAFDKDDNTRALVPEFVSRVWRRVKFGRHAEQHQRVLLSSDLEALNTSMRPYTDATEARAKQVQPAIPLSELVAMTTPIRGDAYRAFYFTDPAAADIRQVRIAQGAEVPRVKITGGDHTIRLYKYGRAIEITYETLRRQSIDKVAYWITRMAVQAEVDKVATAIDVLVSGDGNANTAATSYNLTTLDSAATAPTLTLKAWLAFKLKFTNPYAITAALVQEAVALQLVLLSTGNANIPLVNLQQPAGFGGLTPINPELRDNVRLGITGDAPTLKIVGFDSRFALERVTEIGADIQEVERWATRQTQALVLTETEGYAVLDQLATKVMDVNA